MFCTLRWPLLWGSSFIWLNVTDTCAAVIASLCAHIILVSVGPLWSISVASSSVEGSSGRGWHCPDIICVSWYCELWVCVWVCVFQRRSWAVSTQLGTEQHMVQGAKPAQLYRLFSNQCVASLPSWLYFTLTCKPVALGHFKDVHWVKSTFIIVTTLQQVTDSLFSLVLISSVKRWNSS